MSGRGGHGFLGLLLDFILTICTGGVWLIWVVTCSLSRPTAGRLRLSLGAMLA